jgi:hypothetical protein
MLIAVGASAVIGFSIHTKRKNESLAAKNQRQFADDVRPYRSLFEPDEAELRASEREAQLKVEAERKQAEQNILFERTKEAREFETIWRAKPTRKNTIELLRLASETESAEIFSQTAESVIQIFHSQNEQSGGLSKQDLADLLDSHLRTLPQQESMSGACFWIKREIKNLRAESERL